MAEYLLNMYSKLKGQLNQSLAKKRFVLFSANVLTPRRSFFTTPLIASKFIPTFVAHADSSKDTENPRIKNLVFRGGGPKGTVYIGAIKALEKQLGSLAGIERVAGASAGAITAALLAVGYQSGDIEELLSKTSYQDFLIENETADAVDEHVIRLAQAASPHSHFRKFTHLIWEAVKHPVLTTQLVKKFKNERGICSGEQFREWMDLVISKKVAEIENKPIENFRYLTYGELAELIKAKPTQYKNLYIIGAQFDLNDKLERPVYHTETKDMANYIISDSVRASMSIPFVFTPHGQYILNKANHQRERVAVAINTKNALDGGVLDNYPVHLFDVNQYLSTPDAAQHPTAPILNLETVGITLYDKRQAESFWQWGKKTLTSIRQDSSPYWKPLLEDNKAGITRHISIDVKGTGLLDFSLPPAKIKELVASGEKHVQDYFKTQAITLKTKQDEQRHQYMLNNDALIRKHLAKTNLTSHHYSDYFEKPAAYHVVAPYLKHFHRTDEDNPGANNQSVSLAMTGLSGSGKSELARYCAHRYGENHFWFCWQQGLLDAGALKDETKKPVIWIFKTEDENLFLEDYLSLADNLDEKLGESLRHEIAQQTTKTPAQKAQAIHKRIENTLMNSYHYLLVYDNVTPDNEKAIRQYYLSGGFKNGLNIITTTIDKKLLANTNHYRERLDLSDGLEENQAKQLLSRITNIPAQQISSALVVGALESNPWAITLAGHYLNQHPDLTPQAYLADFTQQHKMLEKQLTRVANDLGDRPSLQAALQLSLNKLKATPLSGETAYQLLQLCSYLQPDELPQSLLANYLSVTQPKLSSDELADVLVDSLKLVQAYSFLRETSLLKIKVDKTKEAVIKLYRIHRTTQQLMQSQVDTGNHFNMDTVAQAINQDLEKDTTLEHDYYQKRYLLPHIVTLLDQSQRQDSAHKPVITPSALAKLNFGAGQLYKALGNPKKALAYALNIPTQSINDDKEFLIKVALLTGRACQALEKFETAKDNYEKAYQVAKKLPSLTLLTQLEIKNDVGMAWRDLGDQYERLGHAQAEIDKCYTEAYAYLRPAYEAVCSNQDKTYDKIKIRVMTNYMEVLRKQNKLKAAEDVRKAIAPLVENPTGIERLVASYYFNSARLYSHQQQWKSGKDNIEKAIYYGEEEFKDIHHPLKARHLLALAQIQQELKEDAYTETLSKAWQNIEHTREPGHSLYDDIKQAYEAIKPHAPKIKQDNFSQAKLLAEQGLMADKTINSTKAERANAGTEAKPTSDGDSKKISK